MFKENEIYKEFIGCGEKNSYSRIGYELLKLANESVVFFESLEVLIEGELLRIVIESHK